MSDINLAEIQAKPTQELVSLPANTIYEIQHKVHQHIDEAKFLKRWFDELLTLRYREQAMTMRALNKKDAGTVHFDDSGVHVTVQLPKRIEWDQKILCGLVNDLKTQGKNPSDYVDVSFKVSEHKYNAWPQDIKKLFEPARTFKTGKQTFNLSTKSES